MSANCVVAYAQTYVRALRLSFAGNQHLHRRFVGVQHVLLVQLSQVHV
ncbi:hypothetical protein BamMEX5DRAFT_6997 [Burkholderia ambifaria MEX-5]|uniref:Uncharacterized protein n=1 Tax=Burkholderia ambifaria MEX-5 TaxID=396597 RepID=B1TGT1_9BURK|nr:hypothetical protein BamMEX5DRAFT_6997 [Burkholderia ambifaria MEX-5]